MITLRNTIGRLQSPTEPNPTRPSEDAFGSALLDALMGEIERLASDSLYRGRPLGAQPLGDEAPGAARGPGSGIESLDLHGVEVLEGCFESTNDRLVGLFEERRAATPQAEWLNSGGGGLPGGVAPLTTPILPFSLSRGRRRGGSQADTILTSSSMADDSADQARAMILSATASSLRVQANTSERLAQQLLR